jgi:predicted TIM-barrel fold metal-dependent hydrolase
MDKVGVARSLVWHVESRDLNPTYGNRRLLREIAETPEAADRLVPALAVYPASIFEHGAMDSLRESLSEGGVRAIRLFPGILRFRLRQLQRALEEVRSFRPAIFWNVQDSTGTDDYRELGELAEHFHELPFVCTEGMWPHTGHVLDLMWRFPNVYTDNSWLHVRDNIELIVEEFGPERLLFGLGSKNQYGAAIAALSQARISDDARELIAHGNLERLLGMKALSKPPKFEDKSEKPFWNLIRSGKAVENVDIVDAHVHIGPPARGWIMPEIELEEQIRGVKSQMDRLGIATGIVIPEQAIFGEPVEGNRVVEQAIEGHGDRFRGYLAYNPFYASEMDELLDDFFSRGFFVGFKLLVSYWKVTIDDERFRSVWEYADLHRLPILLHTWGESWMDRSHLGKIASDYPDAIFLLGHSGGSDEGRRMAVKLVREFPNFYLEWCGSFTTSILWEETLEQVGCDRVVFGTDTAFHSAAWELGRLLSLPVPDEKLVPILGTNMRNILAGRK